MTDSSSADTTKLLRAWAAGDSQALEELTPRVYRELRRMAGRFLQNERPGHTLQSTDLVHELYLRLRGRVAGSSAGSSAGRATGGSPADQEPAPQRDSLLS
jgi:DNA-directed RNA polymerase specialized sigma24 family protein